MSCLEAGVTVMIYFNHVFSFLHQKRQLPLFLKFPIG